MYFSILLFDFFSNGSFENEIHLVTYWSTTLGHEVSLTDHKVLQCYALFENVLALSRLEVICQPYVVHNF